MLLPAKSYQNGTYVSAKTIYRYPVTCARNQPWILTSIAKLQPTRAVGLSGGVKGEYAGESLLGRAAGVGGAAMYSRRSALGPRPAPVYRLDPARLTGNMSLPVCSVCWTRVLCCAVLQEWGNNDVTCSLFT